MYIIYHNVCTFANIDSRIYNDSENNFKYVICIFFLIKLYIINVLLYDSLFSFPSFIYSIFFFFNFFF